MVFARLLILGLFIWGVPFGLRALLIDAGVDQKVWLVIYQVSFYAMAALCTMLAFRLRHMPPVVFGVVVGLGWAVLSVALDGLFLSPYISKGPQWYTVDFGQRYAVLPLMGLAVGWVLSMGLKAKEVEDL